jgi:hypothetical protein
MANVLQAHLDEVVQHSKRHSKLHLLLPSAHFFFSPCFSFIIQAHFQFKHTFLFLSHSKQRAAICPDVSVKCFSEPLNFFFSPCFSFIIAIQAHFFYF